MPSRDASIELEDEMSRNEYLKNNNEHWTRSLHFEASIITTTLIAFLCNQILIYSILFKEDVGILTTNFARSIALSNDMMWTLFASLSITIEIIFVIETALRMMLVKGFSDDIPCVIEGVLVIFYLVPRLLLPVRISLLIDLCILFRCWRIKRIMDIQSSFEKDLLYFTTSNIIKEKDQLELLYKKELEKTRLDLKAAHLQLG